MLIDGCDDNEFGDGNEQTPDLQWPKVVERAVASAGWHGLIAFVITIDLYYPLNPMLKIPKNETHHLRVICILK